MEKGTTSFDFIIAVVMFISIYATMMLTLTYPLANIGKTDDIFKRESDLLTQIVTKTPGYPPNWTEIDQVERFGLTLYNDEGNNPNLFDMNKVRELDSTPCTTIQEKLPVSTNIKISVNINGKTYECNR